MLAREIGAEDVGAVDPLAGMDYKAEIAGKNTALTRFWRHHGLAGVPDPVLPSPRPRHYRTTSRRRVHAAGGQVRFGFDEDGGTREPAVAESALEPLEHAAIYRFLHERVAAPPYQHLARHLNHLIIRGTYEEFCVVFNVDRLDADIVRKIKLLAEHLQSGDLRVTSAFIYHDPLRSRYYFEQFAPETGMRMKHVFGHDRLMTTVSGRRYLYAVNAFSQVNESMLPVLCETVEAMVRGEGERLIDLYCGYGLFSHYLADRFGEIVGVDAHAGAIESAEQNSRLNPARARRTFVAREIAGHSLPGVLKRLTPVQETVILDPPRQGTGAGVIEYVAARRPQRVVHIFCNVDEIPPALAEWKRGGYSPARIVPLDLFPGTPSLEIVISLVA